MIKHIEKYHRYNRSNIIVNNPILFAFYVKLHFKNLA